MTIAATSGNRYTGNGVLTAFDFTFLIYEAEDLQVSIAGVSGDPTVLVLDTDYTVSAGPWPDGGTVTLDEALGDEYTIAILRVRDLVQDTDLRNQGGFYRESVETALDKVVMLDQQQQDEIDRSVKVPTTTDPSQFDATLPTPIAGKVLAINDNGDGFALAEPDVVIAEINPAPAWPIGSVFISTVATDPSDLLGFGTWSAIGAGKVLIGQDAGDSDFNTLGETGGAKTVLLDVNQIPAHAHTITDPGHVHAVTDAGHVHAVTDPGHTHDYGGITAGSALGAGAVAEAGSAATSSEATGLTVNSNTTGLTVNSVATGITQTDGAGGSLAHANLPPYLVVKFWLRVA